MVKLAIITTHPIQYYAPLFKWLSERRKIKVKVFYTWSQSEQKSHDPDFNREIKWDIPLLNGYEFVFVSNIATKPGSRSFKGIINPTLISEVEQWGASAILVFGWAFESHLKAIRYFKGKLPVYFRGDSNLLAYSAQLSFKKIFRRLFLTWVYSHINKAFYVGAANKQYYLKFGLSEAQLLFAPHAVDNQRFWKASNFQLIAESKVWRSKRGIDDDDIVFLFVGKFYEVKDPFTLIKAFGLSLTDNSWLLFVGNGKFEDEMKEVSKHNPHIIFEDFQNQSKMPLMYNIGDIYVLPSLSETWGLAVNEAMACSKPVIVSDKVGCAQDLVHEGENGFIFKSGDYNELGRIMTSVQKREVDLAQMGKRSLEIISNYNFEAICEAIESEVVANQILPR